jgi:hypothetical protein
MQCLKDRLSINLSNINNQLIENKNKLSNIIDNNSINTIDNIIDENNNTEVIEGFFGGFSNFFSGSSPVNLPVSPGTLGNENLNILEKKINDKTTKSSTFPPKDTDDNNNEFKDSDNNDILNIGKNMQLDKNGVNKNEIITKSSNFKSDLDNKMNLSKDLSVSNELLSETNVKENKKETTKLNNNINNNINNINNNKEIKKLDEINNDKLKNKDTEPIINKLPQGLFDSCQFYNDKCPDNYKALGNFAISGVGSGSILTCGDVQNTKPAHAIAEIKSNSVYEIHITDPGHGFIPSKPPKIKIEGGKGNGATAEGVVDDNGYLKIIKVINPGYNYTETPTIYIDAPYMNSSCHLCCKI